MHINGNLNGRKATAVKQDRINTDNLSIEGIGIPVQTQIIHKKIDT